MSKRNKPTRIRVGVDTGGTFTDFVFENGGRLDIFKLPSTPADPSLAIHDGLTRICNATRTALTALDVVHGTTVGTNALLQRRGARTALVTTKGFEDVLVIGRQARPELYNLNAIKSQPLVADELRFGIAERVVASGAVLEPLDEGELAGLAARLRKTGVESVAISLLFSFLHPRHEEQIAAALASLGVPLSISHRLLPEYREYERTSTVTINAYLQPLMGRYLNRLVEIAPGEFEPESSNKQRSKAKVQRPRLSLRVMQSSGGSISAQAAASEPARTILSGPSGGVVGALRVAQAAGFTNIITFDMGGTSTDVSLCDSGGIRTTNEATIAGLPVAVSVMDIHTVGAGGGSIARVDEGGSLRVGPDSAGAEPGPACYGRSFLPTVTDAHLVLGHFAGKGLLGGEFRLDNARASEALTLLASELSKVAGKRVSVNAAAEGVIAVANTNMERALRHISVERGHDPRQFALLPFGGAGGLHAVDLARSLRIPWIMAPTSAGALSAIGVLAADVIKDQSRTVMLRCRPSEVVKLSQTFKEMEREARAVLRSEGFATSRQQHNRSLAMRYLGQSFDIEIQKTTGDIAATFHEAHRDRYGYAQESCAIEIVSARLRSSGLVKTLPETHIRVARRTRSVPPHEYVNARFERKNLRVGVYHRGELPGNVKLQVPCIVAEYSATTLIPPEVKAWLDEHANLIIQVG